MAELILHEVEFEIIRRLEHRAASHGITSEAEHRQILQEALAEEVPDPAQYQVLKDILFQMPEGGGDDDFKRVQEYPGDIDLL